MIDQEFGLFLEIDRNLAAKSDVAYRGRGPWYFSDGIYLLSYDPVERKKIIDEFGIVFNTMKDAAKSINVTSSAIGISNKKSKK